MKTLLLLINLLQFESDTIVFNYGNDLYMIKDTTFTNNFKLKEELPDGVYIVMDNYGGVKKFKRREVTISDSIKIVDINYYKNPFIQVFTENHDSLSNYSYDEQPPIEMKYELIENHIEKYTKYHENSMVQSIEIINRNLENQKLISERAHYENGALKMILEKNFETDQYWIHYYSETGELEMSGQFDEFNRPSGIWTLYYSDGNKKMEGPVCSECVNKLWRPWVATSVVYKTGIWNYYNKEGSIVETKMEENSER